MDSRPIGVFDSGFGGLTVARAMIDLLPAEDVVYLGDTGRYPYGSRDLDEVAGFSHQIAELLVREHGAKLLVVACNTATAAAVAPGRTATAAAVAPGRTATAAAVAPGRTATAAAVAPGRTATAAAVDSLAEAFDVPVIGVIDPGVASLLSVTTTGRVGVIGTVGTIASGAYQAAIAGAAPDAELTCVACPGFVEFVEQGDLAGDQVRVLAERLLAPVRDAGVDALLLGCTHYPFLARTIADVMGRSVVLVSSADETAFAVRNLLAGSDLAAAPGRRGRHRWLSSGDRAWFVTQGRRLLGPELDTVEPVTWDGLGGGSRRSVAS